MNIPKSNLPRVVIIGGGFAGIAVARELRQQKVQIVLIDRGMTFVDGVRTYDFGPVIWFWIGSSVLSMLLAASLWRVRRLD